MVGIKIEKRYSVREVVRVTARLWSVASLGVILGFIFGEGINPNSLSEWVGFLFFPVGISFGMVLAWWKERLGGAITVGSLLVFYVTHFAITRTLPQGWAWLLFAFPGFLFLMCWDTRTQTKQRTIQALRW